MDKYDQGSFLPYVFISRFYVSSTYEDANINKRFHLFYNESNDSKAICFGK